MKGRGTEASHPRPRRGAVVAGLPEGHNAPRYIWRCSKNDLIKSDGGTIAGILREWGSTAATVSARDGGHAVLDERPLPARRRGQIKTTNLRKQHQADRASNTATIRYERVTNEARELPTPLLLPAMRRSTWRL